jgi:triosephosphate isomerase
MRTRYLFAALKNQLDAYQTLTLTLAVREFVQPGGSHVVGISPSAAALAWAGACRGELVLAAQNCGWRATYALTGELTPRDLEVFSIPFCIIGHSERRLYLGETESMIVQRLGALLPEGIIPILCVGETLDQRRSGTAVAVTRAQLTSFQAAFQASGVAADPARIVVAYEPVWSISTSGSNLTAEPSDVVTTHRAIRGVLDDLFGSTFGAETSVIFGGGVEAGNVTGYLREPEVDGALVGAGMQTAPGFLEVLAAFYESGRRRPV